MIFFTNFVNLLSAFLEPFGTIFIFFLCFFFVVTVPCLIRHLVGFRR